MQGNSAVRHVAGEHSVDTTDGSEDVQPPRSRLNTAGGLYGAKRSDDGEAVRGRLQYWKASTEGIPDWKTAIVVLAGSGTGNGEAELRFYEDEGEAAALFEANDRFPKDVKPSHIVTIPNDRLATVNKDHELKIHVDTQADYQSEKWSRWNHDSLVLRPLPSDPLEIQLREAADPEVELFESTAATKKDYLDVWTTGLKSLQAVDTCLTATEPDKMCHSQCTYVGHDDGFGGCFPAQFCVEEAEVSSGLMGMFSAKPVPTCKAVQGEAKSIDAWNGLLTSVQDDLKTVKNCLATCQADWDRALRNSKFLSEFHDKLMDDPLKSVVEKVHPGLLRAVQDSAPHLQQITASFAETFDSDMGSGIMSLALQAKGCNLRQGALTELVASQEKPDELMPLLDEMMKNCPLIGKNSEDLAAEMDQEVTTEEGQTQKKLAQAELGKMDGTAMQAALLSSTSAKSGSLVQRLEFGAVSNVTVSNGTYFCEAVCIAVLVGIAVGVAIGIFLLIFGKIMCYIVTKLTMSSDTEDEKATQKYRKDQCSTWVNRVASVFMIAGAVAVALVVAVAAASVQGQGHGHGDGHGHGYGQQNYSQSQGYGHGHGSGGFSSTGHRYGDGYGGVPSPYGGRSFGGYGGGYGNYMTWWYMPELPPHYAHGACRRRNAACRDGF